MDKAALLGPEKAWAEVQEGKSLGREGIHWGGGDAIGREGSNWERGVSEGGKPRASLRRWGEGIGRQ